MLNDTDLNTDSLAYQKAPGPSERYCLKNKTMTKKPRRSYRYWGTTPDTIPWPYTNAHNHTPTPSSHATRGKRQPEQLCLTNNLNSNHFLSWNLQAQTVLNNE